MAAPPESAPTTAAIASATAIISLAVGFFIGQGYSIGVFGQGRVSQPRHAVGKQPPHEDSESDLTDDSTSENGHERLELATFPDNDNEECKLVLVTRTDLGMGKGKIAAQCGHATLACYKTLLRQDPAHPLLTRWERLGQAKVALKADSEEELLTLQAQALSLGLCAEVIHDAGRTQIASGSATVLGIGPAPKSKVDEVTGSLKLL